MKANEMTHEQLADEMDSLDVDPARWEWKDGSHNEYYNRLNEAFEEATERLRTLTALEAKIKGMIERPKVDITRLTYPSGKEVWYVKLNRHTLLQGDGYHSKTMAEMEACRIADALGVTPEFQKTKALGMEGDK